MMSGLSSQYSSLTQQASMLQGQAQYAQALGNIGFSIGSSVMPSGGLGSLNLSGMTPDTAGPRGYTRKR